MEQLERDRPMAVDAAAAVEGSRTARQGGRRATKPTVFVAHPSDLLTDHLPNGDGLVAHGFIKELARRGYRLHVALRAAELRDPLPGDVTLHAIARSSPNLLLDRLHYMLAIRRLLRRLRSSEPVDVVHQMNPVFAGLSLGLAGCGLPIVLGTFVARWPEDRRGWGRLRRAPAAAARWAISLLQQRQASRLLLTTPAALDRVPLARLARHKIVTVGHGVDAALFSPAAERKGTAACVPPSILFYAHVDRRKGIFVLLEAFREVVRAVPSCRLTVAGRGDHMAEFERAVAASGCPERIRILGKVARDQAPELFRSHSVYCLPSFGEPYATTALEAMSCGLPMVVTDAGGLTHMVPKAGGVRVPPGDARALAAALVTILRSPDLQARMGAVNRAHVERHCTWQRVADDLEQVYLQVTDRQRALS